jgi:ABC-type lipoprotein export system ATPase subunit/ABC-type lipoprotein release transport system permease subunit
MLELKHVFKKYAVNSEYILNDINLKLDKGLISIEGTSGSGKSTLLNLIGLLDKPTKGIVSLDGKNLKKLKKKEIDYYHYKKIGFIFQNYNLIEYLTVYENITITHTSNDVDKILKDLNIYKLKNKKVNKLSGGEKGRVAIARVLVQDPDILLCDEPTGALDSKTGEVIMNILKKISKKKLVIMVTHNHDYSVKYADRIISIKDGRIVDDTKQIKKNSTEVKEKYTKVHFKINKLFKIIINNLINKWKRNVLTAIAFSIGLISLLLVLGIRNGFSISLDNYNKEYASNFPIYISPYTQDKQEELNDLLKEKEVRNDKVYSYQDKHVNKIDKEFVDYINIKNNLIKYNIYGYSIDSKTILTIPTNNIDDFYNNFNMLYGNIITNNYDVILVLDSSNNLNQNLLKQLNLKNDSYSYEELIGYKYKVNNNQYTISGIMKLKENNILQINSCILYKDTFNSTPNSIYLYPNNIDDKNELVKYIKEYKTEITFTDYSDTIKTASDFIIKAASIILISFSIISLIVSSFMIGIITYISVLERVHEIGLFKSLGISNSNIRRIFIIENIFIALLASIISIVITMLISYPINDLLFEYTSLNNILLLNTGIVFIIVIISIIVSVLGSFIPAFGISRLKIVDALKYE